MFSWTEFVFLWTIDMDENMQTLIWAMVLDQYQVMGWVFRCFFFVIHKTITFNVSDTFKFVSGIGNDFFLVRFLSGCYVSRKLQSFYSVLSLIISTQCEKFSHDNLIHYIPIMNTNEQYSFIFIIFFFLMLYVMDYYEIIHTVNH